MICPKCKSPNIYTQDGQNCCMMCGKRFPLEFRRKLISCETRKEFPMSKKGNCRNCERPSTIVADGLCGMCYGHVHAKYTKGTVEYDQALATAKHRAVQWESLPAEKSITEMQTKRRGRKPKTPSTKPMDPKKDILSVLEDRAHAIMEEYTEITKTIQAIKKYLKAA